MSKPIVEPTYGRDIVQHGYDIRQLQRRPAPPSGTEVPWASGNGNVTDTTAGDDTTPVFPDIDDMVTNRPDIFNLGTSNEPGTWGSSWSSTCIGLEILVPSFYRIWASMNYASVYNGGLTGPNFSGAGYNNYIFASTFLDFTEARGFNRVGFFGSPTSTATLIHTFYMADFAYYDSQPIVDSSTVIPFGLVQNTGHGGQYDVDFLIYQLPSGDPDSSGDFDGVTYLPGSS